MNTGGNDTHAGAFDPSSQKHTCARILPVHPWHQGLPALDGALFQRIGVHGQMHPQNNQRVEPRLRCGRVRRTCQS
eukprot:1143255-Pelagomonas_calceolata.AAC.1